MDKESYKKFHKKVRAWGIAMLCVVAATLIYLIVGLCVYQSVPLLLIIGLPIWLSADVTLLLLCYFFSKKDRDMRAEFRTEKRAEGASAIFYELYRDFCTTHLESIWDSVTPNGWKLRDVYEVEDKIELVLDEKVSSPHDAPFEMTLQFGETEVTVFFDYGDEEDTVTEQLLSDTFPDYPSFVIWLGNVCQQFADKAADLRKAI